MQFTLHCLVVAVLSRLFTTAVWAEPHVITKMAIVMALGTASFSSGVSVGKLLTYPLFAEFKSKRGIISFRLKQEEPGHDGGGLPQCTDPPAYGTPQA